MLIFKLGPELFRSGASGQLGSPARAAGCAEMAGWVAGGRKLWVGTGRA